MDGWIKLKKNILRVSQLTTARRKRGGFLPMLGRFGLFMLYNVDGTITEFKVGAS